MAIPFYDMRLANETCRLDMEKAMARVMDRSWYILGEELEMFEQEFAAFCGISHCVGVNSGTDALWLALVAAGLGPGDEVLTVSHTFVATAIAVRMTGAVPIFADVNPDTLLMDLSSAESKITEHTRAILPVHLYGRCCDLSPLREFADRYNLSLIEDASQAHGSQSEGRSAGTFLDYGCFSFYPTKNLGALGDGGAIVTDDESMATELRRLRNYGETRKYHHKSLGFNSRLDEMQAAILRAKLPNLPKWNAEREMLAQAYLSRLDGEDGIQLPTVPINGKHVWHLFVIRLTGSGFRDLVKKRMAQQGVATACHYPVPVHMQEAFSDLDIPLGSLPVTEQVASEILSLPLFPGMKIDEVDQVCEVLKNSLKF